MPIYDRKYLIHNNAIIGQAGDEASADYIDLGCRSVLDGLHIVVTETFVGMDVGCIIWITVADSAPPGVSVIGRWLEFGGVILLLKAGMHYFIPYPSLPARYWGAYFQIYPGGTNPTAGKLTMYFGPNEDGTI